MGTPYVLIIRSAVSIGPSGSVHHAHDRRVDHAAQADSQCVEDAARALDGDSVVLVALIARDLRLVHVEVLRELALREAPRNS